MLQKHYLKRHLRGYESPESRATTWKRNERFLLLEEQ